MACDHCPWRAVVTRLHGELRRELSVKGRAYVVTLDDDGIKLTLKGHRKGQQLRWEDLVNGDAALAVALNASLAQAGERPPTSPMTAPETKRRRRARSR